MNNFVERILNEHDQITTYDWISSDIVQIDREGKQSFSALFLGEAKITNEMLPSFQSNQIDFISSIPKSCIWEGDAIRACETRPVGWGAIGDFMAACNDDEPQNYKPKKLKFIRRILSQHRKVRSVEFIYDQLLKVELENNKELKIAIIQDYDVTAEGVRNIYDKLLDDFDILYKNNPNGTITSDAGLAASDLDIEILDSSGLSKKLHRIG